MLTGRAFPEVTRIRRIRSQYYFEFKERPDKAWLYPGFAENLANLPYFVVRRA